MVGPENNPIPRMAGERDSMEIYSTNWGDDTITISADFSEASSPVIGDPCGRQVADFRHSPRRAMRAALEAAARADGLQAEEAEDKIEDALDRMTVAN